MPNSFNQSHFTFFNSLPVYAVQPTNLCIPLLILLFLPGLPSPAGGNLTRKDNGTLVEIIRVYPGSMVWWNVSR